MIVDTDLLLIATQHVINPVIQHAQACPVIPPCPTCPSFMKQLFEGNFLMYEAIAGVVSLAIGFGLGWYIKGRGLTGVQNDLNSVKTDVSNIKAKIFPNTTATPAA